MFETHVWENLLPLRHIPTFAPVKRKIIISIFLGVFALMLSHLLIPHHHHSDHTDATLMEKHDGDGDHPDHHHHTIDTFFSLLQFVDEVSPHFVVTQFENHSSAAIVAALLLWSLEEENQAGAIEMPDIPWRRVSLPAAHSLRGPPLA